MSVILITRRIKGLVAGQMQAIVSSFRSLLTMAGFLASSSIGLWFLLMVLVYCNVPGEVFVPFFIISTIWYMKMMESAGS